MVAGRDSAEIDSGVASIMRTAEKSEGSLRKRELRSRIARSIIIGFLVCAVILAILSAYFLASSIRIFPLHTSTDFRLFITSAVSSWLGGSFITYVILSKRKNPHLEELSELISQIKKNREAESTTENALSLADRILTILPEMTRKRTEDSVFYGILAFIASLVASQFLPAAIIVGVAVWLLLRYQMNKSYKREVAKFEEQRRAFEKRKKDFLESL